MKKLIPVLLALAILLCLAACGGPQNTESVPSESADSGSQGLAFELDPETDTYYVTGIGSCTDTLVRIPTLYSGKQVTGIGAAAFSGCKNLTSIVLPIGIVSVGDSAFAGCDALVEIQFCGSQEQWEAIEKGENWNGGKADLNMGYDYQAPGGNTPGGNQPGGDEPGGDEPGGDEPGGSHMHNYSKEVVAPTCTDTGATTYICTCGDSYTETVPATGHKLENNVCQNCGVTMQPSEGLNMTLNSDGQSYCVTGRGTCKDANIVIPSTYNGLPVTSIGYEAFRCAAITTVTIPDSVTAIGSYAFQECPNLTSITIPDSVTSIGGGLFYRCKSLTSINLPDSMTEIGGYIFYGCESLTSINIPDGVTSIRSNAFSFCRSLTNITIPDGVTEIETGAFSICESLTNITIPDSVTSIERQAFYCCSSLTSISIPDSVTSIADGGTFGFCTNLTSISVAPGNTVYHSSGNCLIETAAKKLVAGCKNSVIPDDGSVTSIGDSAFYGCENLTSITIPDGVTSIGEYAFSGCSSLTSITIPDGVTGISKGMFSGCENLTSITIPDSVGYIGEKAFTDCTNLTNITIPGSVTTIVKGAFTNCSKLSSITFEGTVAQWEAITFGWGSFRGWFTIYCTDGEIRE